jgi:LuxR family transcriptional regulator, quorum-sensing system regulator BjaR1
MQLGVPQWFSRATNTLNGRSITSRSCSISARTKDICGHITKELEWFGFTCVTSFSLPGPGAEVKDGILLNTRPEEYTRRYYERNYVIHDPAVKELRRNLNPYTWSDIRKNRKLGKFEKTILDESTEFKWRDGLVIPIVTLSGQVSLFCPCGPEPDLSPRARAALEVIGIYSYHALKRAIAQMTREVSEHQPLTAREREIMQWVAYGKSDDEIGEILNLSTTTVTSHVENAKRKLNTFRRTYAVVQAVRYGEISL